MDRSEYVFVGKEVIKAQVFDRDRNSTNCSGITVKLNLGVGDTDVHGIQPFTEPSHAPPSMISVGPGTGRPRWLAPSIG